MLRVERIVGALLGALVLAGLLMAFGVMDPPGSLDKFYPSWLDNVWAGWVTTSAATTLLGMLWQKMASKWGKLLVPTAAYATEFVGLSLGAATFAIHVVAVALVTPDRVNYLSLIHIGLVVGCVLQARDNIRFLRRAERPGERGQP